MINKMTRELNKFVNIVHDNRHEFIYFDLYYQLSKIPTFMLHSRGKYKYIFWYHVYKLMLPAKV